MEILFLWLLVPAAILITWLVVKNRYLLKTGALQSKLSASDQLVKSLESGISEEKGARAKSELVLQKALADLAALRNALINSETNIKNLTSELESYKSLLHEVQTKSTALAEQNARLSANNEGLSTRLREQDEFLKLADTKLKESFDSLSAKALRSNNETFITLAKSTLEKQVADANGELAKKQQAIDAIVKPLSESLSRFDEKIEHLEKVRSEQHGQINQYIHGVQLSTEKLHKETSNLVSALKTSHTRGKYGEIGLRRLVEFSGMTEHCDFLEQVSVSDENGLLRPDMIISMPERKKLIVDAKVPLASYMRAFETENEAERNQLLSQHASALKEHLKKLSAKAYWSQFDESPDYVVMYLQIESSFGAALQVDPTLIEEAIRNRVIFATPTTLITLLKTIGFVWQQVLITQGIEEIKNCGIELYNRTTTLVRHFASIGGSLKTTVSHYNNAVASLESRFMPQAKRLYDLGSAYTKHTLTEPEQVDVAVRTMTLPLDKARLTTDYPATPDEQPKDSVDSSPSQD